ncbi:MAG: hypothetical protein QNK18_01830 [Gammaproteobacteria bacterium]|nr:hypothetical protein [Gammaproteobacteria bacterium]MDJ0889923.1 hypothetical protein [Gammaproteobacteria bacterium]
MAKAMTDAFKDEWPNFMGDQPLPPEDKLKSLIHIFVAVSQGLVRHLAENPGAFRVDVSITDEGEGSGQVSEIHTNPETP